MNSIITTIKYIGDILSFVPIGFTWIVRTIVQIFATIAKFKDIWAQFTSGRITNWYIPTEYFNILAPVFSIVLFFGILTLSKRWV